MQGHLLLYPKGSILLRRLIYFKLHLIKLKHCLIKLKHSFFLYSSSQIFNKGFEKSFLNKYGYRLDCFQHPPVSLSMTCKEIPNSSKFMPGLSLFCGQQLFWPLFRELEQTEVKPLARDHMSKQLTEKCNQMLQSSTNSCLYVTSISAKTLSIHTPE